MKNHWTPFRSQYEYIKDSREALFTYCQTISSEDFHQNNSTFGRGSIRNLLVHTANTYEFWIGRQGLGREILFTDYQSVVNLADVRETFAQVDQLVEAYFTFLEENDPQTITFFVNNRKQQAEPLRLLTHVITHEFHHKGQILSLSRHLGYEPVDTDVMR